MASTPPTDTATAPAGTTIPGADALQAARDTIANKAGPLAGQARQFAKDRPWTAAALVGVVGLAVLNTLRGR